MKLSLARSDISSSQSYISREIDPRVPPAPKGEYLGLSAIARAAAGQDQARALAKQARDITGAIEATFYSDFADLILTLKQSAVDDETIRMGRDLVLKAN